MIGGQYAEVVKYLALGLPKAACKVLWNSESRLYLKELILSEMDSEMQSICSTTNPSVLRDDLMKFNLEDFEKEFSTKAPLTNELLQILCTSERQKKKQRSATGKVSNAKTDRASSVKLTAASLILNCRCPQMSALSTRVGLIVRHAGSGRLVSTYFNFLANILYRSF